MASTERFEGDQYGDRFTNAVSTIRTAWAVVEAARIPQSLESVAFEQAVGLLVGAGLTSIDSDIPAGDATAKLGKAVPNGGSRAAGPQNSDVVGITDDDEFFSRFAIESGIDEERLRQVYFVKDGQPRIAVTKGRLGSTEAERNRAVSTLLAGMHWYVSGVPTTTIREIRDAASTIPYEVSRNLASHLEGVAGTVTVGAKNDKAIRVQSGRFDEPFRYLIEAVTEI